MDSQESLRNSVITGGSLEFDREDQNDQVDLSTSLDGDYIKSIATKVELEKDNNSVNIEAQSIPEEHNLSVTIKSESPQDNIISVYSKPVSKDDSIANVDIQSKVEEHDPLNIETPSLSTANQNHCIDVDTENNINSSLIKDIEKDQMSQIISPSNVVNDYLQENPCKTTSVISDNQVINSSPSPVKDNNLSPSIEFNETNDHTDPDDNIKFVSDAIDQTNTNMNDLDKTVEDDNILCGMYLNNEPIDTPQTILIDTSKESCINNKSGVIHPNEDNVIINELHNSTKVEDTLKSQVIIESSMIKDNENMENGSQKQISEIDSKTEGSLNSENDSSIPLTTVLTSNSSQHDGKIEDSLEYEADSLSDSDGKELQRFEEFEKKIEEEVQEELEIIDTVELGANSNKLNVNKNQNDADCIDMLNKNQDSDADDESNYSSFHLKNKSNDNKPETFMIQKGYEIRPINKGISSLLKHSKKMSANIVKPVVDPKNCQISKTSKTGGLNKINITENATSSLKESSNSPKVVKEPKKLKRQSISKTKPIKGNEMSHNMDTENVSSYSYSMESQSVAKSLTTPEDENKSLELNNKFSSDDKESLPIQLNNNLTPSKAASELQNHTILEDENNKNTSLNLATGCTNETCSIDTNGPTETPIQNETSCKNFQHTNTKEVSEEQTKNENGPKFIEQTTEIINDNTDIKQNTQIINSSNIRDQTTKNVQSNDVLKPMTKNENKSNVSKHTSSIVNTKLSKSKKSQDIAVLENKMPKNDAKSKKLTKEKKQSIEKIQQNEAEDTSHENLSKSSTPKQSETTKRQITSSLPLPITKQNVPNPKVACKTNVTSTLAIKGESKADESSSSSSTWSVEDSSPNKKTASSDLNPVAQTKQIQLAQKSKALLLKQKSVERIAGSSVSLTPVRDTLANRRRREQVEETLTEQEKSRDEAATGYVTPLQKKDGQVREMRSRLTDAFKEVQDIENQMDQFMREREEETQNLLDKCSHRGTNLTTDMKNLQKAIATMQIEEEKDQKTLTELQHNSDVLKKEMEESESVHRKMYLEIHSKGKRSAAFERQIDLVRLAHEDPGKVTSSELEERLKMLLEEVSRWRAVKLAERYTKMEKPRTDEEAKLKFMRDSMYHYLTENKREIISEHLQVLIKMFNFTDVQMKSINRQMEERKKQGKM